MLWVSAIRHKQNIWSANNKSYLGKTIHYIEQGTFERKSLVIACRRIKFSHTYENIANSIDAIHKDYEIDVSKVTHTVTDNVSNFGKAFRLFSVSNIILPTPTLTQEKINSEPTTSAVCEEVDCFRSELWRTGYDLSECKSYFINKSSSRRFWPYFSTATHYLLCSHFKSSCN